MSSYAIALIVPHCNGVVLEWVRYISYNNHWSQRSLDVMLDIVWYFALVLDHAMIISFFCAKNEENR